MPEIIMLESNNSDSRDINAVKLFNKFEDGTCLFIIPGEKDKNDAKIPVQKKYEKEFTIERFKNLIDQEANLNVNHIIIKDAHSLAESSFKNVIQFGNDYGRNIYFIGATTDTINIPSKGMFPITKHFIDEGMGIVPLEDFLAKRNHLEFVTTANKIPVKKRKRDVTQNVGKKRHRDKNEIYGHVPEMESFIKLVESIESRFPELKSNDEIEDIELNLEIAQQRLESLGKEYLKEHENVELLKSKLTTQKLQNFM